MILNRRPDATERLVEFANSVKSTSRDRTEDLAWRSGTVDGLATVQRHRDHGEEEAPGNTRVSVIEA